MTKRIFGELELAILKIFKEKDKELTVRDVLQTLGDDDKYTTVMTVMNRLVTKGELYREKEGHSYLYSLQMHKPRFSLLERWKQKIFGGKSALMISYLIESSQDISQEELLEIEKLIEQAKQKKTSKVKK